MIPSGRYALIRGMMFRLDESSEGVRIYTADPPEWLSGWEFARFGNGYQREVVSTDVDEVVDISYNGIYRGIDVEVEPGAGQRHLLLTRAIRAGIDAGFTVSDRELAVKEVMKDDPDLTIEQRRRVVPFPPPRRPNVVNW